MSFRLPPGEAGPRAGAAADRNVDPVQEPTPVEQLDALWSQEGRLATLAAVMMAYARTLGPVGHGSTEPVTPDTRDGRHRREDSLSDNRENHPDLVHVRADDDDNAASILACAEALEAALCSEDFDFELALAELSTRRAHLILLEQAGMHVAEGVDTGLVTLLDDPSLYDTALMLICQDSLGLLVAEWGRVTEGLLTLVEVHQLDAAGLALAQHLQAALQGQMVLSATRDALPCQMPAGVVSAGALAEELGLQVPDLPWSVDPWPLTDIATALASAGPMLNALGGGDGNGAMLRQAVENLFDATAKGEGAPFGRAVEEGLGQSFAVALERVLAVNKVLDRWEKPAFVPGALTAEQHGLVQGALARARALLELVGEGEAG